MMPGCCHQVTDRSSHGNKPPLGSKSGHSLRRARHTLSDKSTLCRAINRLEAIDSGGITIDGEPLPAEGKALAQLRADVGMVFLSFNLFAHKPVLQNVTLGPLKAKGVRRTVER